jgi:DNA replication and repair protein RecF
LKISSLQIENLRNLASVSLEPHPDLNFIGGENGAGKTSILESLFVLSRGRSFRTSTTGDLVGPTAAYFRVVAESVSDEGKKDRLGLERSGKRWRARKNSTDLTKISQLTRSLPLVLMEPNSHQLVSGPPEFRRKFLDWGVFHVEQGFIEIWTRFSRALKQRNSALRQGQREVLDSLDVLLAPLGARLDELRERHSRAVSQETDRLLARLSPNLKGIGLEYHNGWGEALYIEVLAANRERDLERGATLSGPHRMDLVIMKEQATARSILSRGEQKLLSATLLLAQANLLSDLGEKPIILLDDLASEFDQIHFDTVLEAAIECGGQVWVTGTDTPHLPNKMAMFHVKHGNIQKMV